MEIQSSLSTLPRFSGLFKGSPASETGHLRPGIHPTETRCQRPPARDPDGRPFRAHGLLSANSISRLRVLRDSNPLFTTGQNQATNNNHQHAAFRFYYSVGHAFSDQQKVIIPRRDGCADAQDIQRCGCTPRDIYESSSKAQIEIVGLPTACRYQIDCT